MKDKKGSIAVIVAHPDDETLWVGGTILDVSQTNCFILCLTRASDPDRAPKFYKTLAALGASGVMADLDDGPLQTPLSPGSISSTIQELLPPREFDIIYTHSPLGEYDRHLRHEETGRELLQLWLDGALKAKEVRLFAYNQSGKSSRPQAIPDAAIQKNLSSEIWKKKYKIITEIYGFGFDSFEAETTPQVEAFWQVKNKRDALSWLKKKKKE